MPRRIRLTNLLDAFARRLCLTLLPLSFLSCDILPRKGDTLGEQQQAQWLIAARLVVDTDPNFTLVRLRAAPLDSAHGGHHVLLARFEFNPSEGSGDEYALNIALDLGNVRALEIGTAYPLGPAPAGIPAYGTVTCLCRPLKPDSIVGNLMLLHRGVGQLYGRIDATLFFTAWDDSTRHVSYRLRQRFDGMR